MRDEDEAVAEGGEEAGDPRAVLEEVDRDDGVFGEAPFPHEEDGDRDDAEDDQAERVGRSPRFGFSAGFETDQEHDHTADDGDKTDPIDGFQPCTKWSLWCFDLEEEDEHADGETVKR